MISVNVQRAKYSLTGKTCSVYQNVLKDYI